MPDGRPPITVHLPYTPTEVRAAASLDEDRALWTLLNLRWDHDNDRADSVFFEIAKRTKSIEVALQAIEYLVIRMTIQHNAWVAIGHNVQQLIESLPIPPARHEQLLSTFRIAIPNESLKRCYLNTPGLATTRIQMIVEAPWETMLVSVSGCQMNIDSELMDDLRKIPPAALLRDYSTVAPQITLLGEKLQNTKTDNPALRGRLATQCSDLQNFAKELAKQRVASAIMAQQQQSHMP